MKYLALYLFMGLVQQIGYCWLVSNSVDDFWTAIKEAKWLFLIWPVGWLILFALPLLKKANAAPAVRKQPAIAVKPSKPETPAKPAEPTRSYLAYWD